MTNYPTASTDRKVVLAFIFAVLLGGLNSVAIRFSNRELPPFWGATLRFAATSLIFWLILAFRRQRLPSGRNLAALVLIGFFGVGGSFGLLYWGLLRVHASLGTVILALGPLLTFFLAYFHHLEGFRWQGLLGGLVAMTGIALAANAQFTTAAPFGSLAALVVSAGISSEGNVLLKTLSVDSDPVVMNAVSLSSATLFLGLASTAAGEIRAVPHLSDTWVSLAYLISGGSVVMLYLFIYVLRRWTASAAAYIILLFPIVASTAGALLARESLTPVFVLGGLVVMLGVWIGSFHHRIRVGA